MATLSTIKNTFQILRSTVAGKRPPNDPTQAGAPYVNFADGQLGVMDTSGVHQDLVSIRNHLATAKYDANDIVVQGGGVFRAIAAEGPAPWDSSKWDSLIKPSAVQLFNATTAYAPGDLVAHAGKIYHAVLAVPAGAWSATRWAELGAITEFNAANIYKTDVLVTHAGGIWKAKSIMMPGAWDATKWDPVGGGAAIKMFDATKAYVKNDMVAYNGRVWTATKPKAAGAWTPTTKRPAFQNPFVDYIEVLDTRESKPEAINLTGDITLTADQLAFGVIKFIHLFGASPKKVIITIPDTFARVIHVSNNTDSIINFHHGATSTYELAAHSHDIIHTDGLGSAAAVDGLHLLHTLDHDVTAYIGPTGDFPTINEGIAYFTNFYPTYGDDGITVTLILERGFVIREQILTNGINLGWIYINSAQGKTPHVFDAAAVRAKSHRNIGVYLPFMLTENSGIGPKTALHLNVTGFVPSGGIAGVVAYFVSSMGRIALGDVGGSHLECVLFAQSLGDIQSGPINATNTNVAVVARSGRIAIQGLVSSSGGACAVSATGGSIDVGGPIIGNNSTAAGIGVRHGGIITATGLEAKGCRMGVEITVYGVISIRGPVDVSGASSRGIQCSSGFFGNYNAPIKARKGAADSNTDILVSQGGIVIRSVSTGNTGGTYIAPGTFNNWGYINQ